MTDMVLLNRKIRTLVRQSLGMPEHSIRPANQGAPADGEEQFATVLLTMITATGQADSRFENTVDTGTLPGNPVRETSIGQQRVLASVQFFRGDAYSKALKLGTVLQMSAAQERMATAGLGLVRANSAKDLSALKSTLWEQRGQIEIEFHLITSETASTPSFGEFPITVSTETLSNTTEVFEP